MLVKDKGVRRGMRGERLSSMMQVKHPGEGKGGKGRLGREGPRLRGSSGNLARWTEKL